MDILSRILGANMNAQQLPAGPSSPSTTEKCLSIRYIGDSMGSCPLGDFDLDFDATKRLLESQTDLETSLNELRDTFELGSTAAQKISDSLQKAQASTAVLRALTDKLWAVIPPAKHITANSSAAAQQVFDTAELLEGILSYINTPSKLAAMGVQRTWRDTILGSTHLMKSLGLLSYDDGYYYSALSDRFHGAPRGLFNQNSHGWNTKTGRSGLPSASYSDGDRGYFRWNEDSDYSYWTINHQPVIEDPNQLDISFTCSITQLRLGSRVRSMLLCDPPMQTMTAYHDCHCWMLRDSSERAYQDPGVVVRSESQSGGFTIGELVDLTARLKKSHLQCGCSKVRYEGTVKLHEKDEVMVQRRQLEQQALQERQKCREQRRRRREARDNYSYQGYGAYDDDDDDDNSSEEDTEMAREVEYSEQRPGGRRGYEGEDDSTGGSRCSDDEDDKEVEFEAEGGEEGGHGAVDDDEWDYYDGTGPRNYNNLQD